MAAKKEWLLKKEAEMRCEVGENDILTLRLTQGSAEVFGVEMALNKDYSFRDQNIAVFTWYGCTLESWGAEASIYVTDSTPMIAYVNTHVQLQAMRDVALNNSESGPRVMVVGSTDQGKSTITQILTAYAVRLDRNPIFVDLDIGQSSLTVPGCISAASLSKTNLSVEEGICNFTPLVYFHGHTSPKDNIDLYKTLVNNLADKVNQRLERDADTKASGIIVNTCGWVDGPGLEVLQHCIRALSINIVLVINHDKLLSQLTSSLEPPTARGGVTVVKLPVSGGVVTRDSTTRKRIRKSSVKEYFYGRQASTISLTTSIFSPERKENVPISSFVFLQVGGVQLTSGMRVISDTSHQDTCKLIRVNPTADFAFRILAVLNTEGLDIASTASSRNATGEVPQQLLNANVAGFIHVVQIDLEMGTMTLLYPCQGTLPSNYLLVGSVKWVE